MRSKGLNRFLRRKQSIKLRLLPSELLFFILRKVLVVVFSEVVETVKELRNQLLSLPLFFWGKHNCIVDFLARLAGFRDVLVILLSVHLEDTKLVLLLLLNFFAELFSIKNLEANQVKSVTQQHALYPLVKGTRA